MVRFGQYASQLPQTLAGHKGFSHRIPIAALAAFLVATVSVEAQQAIPAQFSGSDLGYVLDAPAKSIRRIVGVPGAAYLGPVVKQVPEGASLSPNGRWVAAIWDGQIRIESVADDQLGIGAGEVTEKVQFAWAPDGATVVIAYPESKTLRIGQHTGDSWNFDAPFHSWAELTGEFALLAVDRTGGIWLATKGTEGSLYRLVAAEQRWEKVTTSTEPVGIVFPVRSANKGYFGEVTRLVEFSLDGSISAMDIWNSQYDRIRSLAVLPAGNPAIAVEGETRAKLVILDGNSQFRTLELDSIPTNLTPLGQRGIFVLGSRNSADDPLLVADCEKNPSVYFIPERKQ